MLQAMRKSMKVILWVTVIFFVLLIFLVWGADLQIGKGPKPGIAGEVNGEPITTAQYRQLLDANRRNAQAQGRELLPGDELSLEEQTWNALVNDLLLREEARRRGLVAHDSEIRAILMNDPPPIVTQDPNFKNSQGQFDMATYRAVIQDPQTPENYLLQLEAYVRDYLPTQKLQELALSGAKVTDEELRRAYLQQNEKAKATIVTVDAFKGPFTGEVSDQDLQTYYDQHKEDYFRPRLVDVLYVMVPRRATVEDSLRIRQDLAGYAQEARSAERSAHAGKVDTEHSDFAALAQSFSDSPTAENGGLSADYVGRSAMSPTLHSRLSVLAPGDVSPPFQDGPFYEIVQLVGTKVDKGDTLYSYRELTVRIAPSDSTIDAESTRLEDLRNTARSQGLRKAAEGAGLVVREAKGIPPIGVVPGLAGIPDVAGWAHESPQGTISRVYPAGNGWYVLEVGPSTPEGIAPLDAVRDQVRADLVRERRLDEARPIADRIVKRVRDGETLEAAAKAENLNTTQVPDFTRQTGIPGLGRDPDAVAAAFVLPVGAVSDPLKSGKGWVILRVDARPDVDWSAFDQVKESLRRNLLANKQNELLGALIDDLRKKAKIVDFRG